MVPSFAVSFDVFRLRRGINLAIGADNATRQDAITDGSRAAAAVLIVDDDAEMAALFSDTLEQEGFRVTVETKGERALALAESEWFDAFIVDKEMPHMSGLGLVSFLRYRFPDRP